MPNFLEFLGPYLGFGAFITGCFGIVFAMFAFVLKQSLIPIKESISSLDKKISEHTVNYDLRLEFLSIQMSGINILTNSRIDQLYSLAKNVE